MSISLVKGQKVSLTKEAGSLDKLVVGLGWDVNNSLFGGSYDLDAAIAICRNGRFISKGDLVYFGHKTALNNAVYHCGDNLTGAGEGDDEQIIVDLTRMPNDVDKLVVMVNIYRATEKKQNFGHVKNAFVRIVDAHGNKEILRYDLTDSFPDAIGMIFGEIYRHGNEWKFNPVGQGVKEKGLMDIANLYK